ncbi:MAG: hypothetical protein ACRYG2_31970, partial [Janthinobacterium lividum]
SFTNLSAPIWAEMLLNFGLWGVPVLSLLMGYALGRLDRAFRDLPESGALPIATAVLPFYLLILLRGSLLQATGSLVVLLASIAFISLPRRVDRAPGRRPPSSGRGLLPLAPTPRHSSPRPATGDRARRSRSAADSASAHYESFSQA